MLCFELDGLLKDELYHKFKMCFCDVPGGTQSLTQARHVLGQCTTLQSLKVIATGISFFVELWALGISLPACPVCTHPLGDFPGEV